MTILLRWFWREPRAVRVALSISAVLFFTSLFFTPFTVQSSEGPQVCSSLLALLTGWGATADNSYAWFANPIGFVAWWMIARRRNTIAIIAGIAAVLLAASFLFERHILIDEAGNTGAILSIGPAYWLWLASIIGTMIAGWLASLRRTKAESRRD